MSIRRSWFWSLSFLLASSGALAAAPEETPLWSGKVPGSEGKTAAEVVNLSEKDGFRRISSIHRPSLTAYLPGRANATGAAVIIMPGGGHRYLAIDNEGHAVGRWLAENGIAGLVLKYRLAREEGSSYKVEVEALADAQRAVRVARSRAAKWNIDPARVGLLGFSAGGQLAALAAARFDAGKADARDPIDRQSSRPAFQALLYAGSPGNDVAIPRDAPPAFVLVASDDQRPTVNALDLFGRLRNAGVKTELHVYSQGGHGFGMKDRPLPVTAWPSRLREWMAAEGFLAPQSTAPASAVAGAAK